MIDLRKGLEEKDIVILPPMDVFNSIALLEQNGIKVSTTILDPWYNKGTGGVRPEKEYDDFIAQLLNKTSKISDIMYLWGFPEIIGPYVRYIPNEFRLGSWLTWYYKNCPSVIRGWRSSQNACIEYIREGAKLYPEHFLSEEQEERFKNGKMRFVPGPSSVIEQPLIIGFIGKNEQTGHPAQKPEAVIEKLILMSTKEGDVVFDPMAGSGTTAAVAKKLRRKCIVCDMNIDYIHLMENRMDVKMLEGLS